MTIGCVLSAYKLPEQHDRLVRHLRTERSHFVVQRKTDERIYDETSHRTQDLGRVDFVDRHVSHWGECGHFWATPAGTERLYAERLPFDRAILLTGQDDLDRLERWHLAGRHSVPRGIHPWGGAPYWCLGRHVLDSVWSFATPSHRGRQRRRRVFLRQRAG